jgi:hypothetical protein
MAVAHATVRKIALDRLPGAPVRASGGAQLATGTVARQLQQRLGNQGTQRFITAARTAAGSAGAHAGLRVASPSDPAELEAHAAGKAIANMALPVAQPALRASAAPVSTQAIHRDALPGAALEKDHNGELRAGVGLSKRIEASKSGGALLPLAVRNFMAPRFGADFSGVRIHTGTQAAQLSSALNARAFTVGQHIFFGQGQFAPGTQAGRELIASKEAACSAAPAMA